MDQAPAGPALVVRPGAPGLVEHGRQLRHDGAGERVRQGGPDRGAGVGGGDHVLYVWVTTPAGTPRRKWAYGKTLMDRRPSVKVILTSEVI